MRRLVALALFTAILVSVGYGARTLALHGLESWRKYRTSYDFDLPPGAPPGGRLAGRVVVVIIEGLREDASRRMPALASLRERGAASAAVLSEPSIAHSGWATILTGARPEIHGVVTNEGREAVPVDTIFREAKTAGLKTALAAGRSWDKLFPQGVDLRNSVDWSKEGDDGVLSAALRILSARAGLTVIWFAGPDAAGHRYGGESLEYLKAAAEADARLTRILAAVDLRETTVVVTSDHGHTAAGGHGGREEEAATVPLIMAGPGVRPGKYPPVRQEDIAPTVAALLGLPAPAQATGRIRPEFLAYPDSSQARAAVAGSINRKLAFYQRYLDALTPPPLPRWAGYVVPRAFLGEAPALPSRPDAGWSLEDLGKYLDSLEGTVLMARDYSFRSDMVPRFPYVAGFLLLAAVYFLAIRKSYLKPALAAAAVYFAIYNAIYFGPWRFGPFFPRHSLTYSVSVLASESLVRGFAFQRALEAALAMSAASFLMGWTIRRSPALEPRVGRGRFGGLNLTAVVSVFLLAQVAVPYVLYGNEVTWYLPDLRLGFKYALDLLQLVVVAAGAPLWAVLTAAVAYRPIPEEPGTAKTPKTRANSRRRRGPVRGLSAGKP